MAGRVVLLGSAARIPEEAKELDRRFGEPWGHGRFTEAGEGMLAEVLPREGLRPVRRLLAPLAGRMLAGMQYNLADVLVETQAEMAYDARPVLSQITAPVLIVAGDRDLFLPREVTEETAAGLRTCRVVWRPGQGHVRTIRGATDVVLAYLREPVAASPSPTGVG